MSTEETAQQEQQDAPRSPLAGCLILIVMLVVILVLIASAGYSVKKQTDAYKTFTETEAKPAPVADVEALKAQLEDLRSRVDQFDQALESKTPAELSLTATDLNLAVAHYRVFENFRGQLSVETIANGDLAGVIHYPFRSSSDLPGFIRGPLNIKSRDNNLNGTFVGTPLLTDGRLILNMQEIKPSVGEVPEEWFAGISRFLISGELEIEDDEDSDLPKELRTGLKEKLKMLTSLEVRDERLILGYKPDATPPSIKTESDAMATKAKHLVALGALIFILIMILAFILLARRQKMKREQA